MFAPVGGVPLPAGLEGGFACRFALPITLTKALPYVEEGVFSHGIENVDPPRQIPTIIRMREPGPGDPIVSYEGSKFLTGLLSMPSAAVATPKNGAGADGAIDRFELASLAQFDHSKLLNLYRGTQPLRDLGVRYLDIAARLADDSVGEIPVGISEVVNGWYDGADDSTRVAVAKHCLAFLAGACFASSPNVAFSKDAYSLFRGAIAFFNREAHNFPRDENMRIEATLIEVIAEMAGEFPFLEKAIAGTSPPLLRRRAGKLWTRVLENDPESPDYEGIYMRAMNGAQPGPDYETLKGLFMTRLARPLPMFEEIQTCLRAAWATLNGAQDGVYDWVEVSALLARANALFVNSDVPLDALSVVTLRDVKNEVEGMASLS